MTLNFKNKGASALLFTAILLLLQTTLYAHGSQEADKQPAQVVSLPDMKLLINTEPSVKPDWVHTLIPNETDFFFVGTSLPYDTVSFARDNARESARIQVLQYYGQVIENQAVSLSALSGTTRDTFAAYVIREDEIMTFAQNVISEVATVAYYTETYLNSNNKEEYIVYTLHKINRQKAEEEISGFASKISERYTASFSQFRTLKSALEGYTLVAKSLEQNPLHRIMAYHVTPSGKAGLYEYVRMQITELSGSVSLESIPNRTIQKTETLNTLVHFNSPFLPSIGSLDCLVSIHGNNNNAPIAKYTINNNNSFQLSIFTNLLEAGRYIVQIELLFQDITCGIARNTDGGFSFDVRPLNEILDTPAAIEAGIKRAVDTLAAELQTQTETVIGPFTMTGTDIPTELSVYLTEKVTHYAKNNQDRKYRVMENGNEQTAIFSGFFTKRTDHVDVTFEITTPNRDRDGSYIFSISVDLLQNTIGIAIEPENINTMIVLDNVLPLNTAQPINISAFLNSSTRTYKHREELKLSVTADHDCYFKIIHINVDKKINTIYPRTQNDDNYLPANAVKNIFDNPNSRYLLYGPYGEETLVVVASYNQFPDQQYNTPWTSATEETIIATIAGDGESRYPINIIKPHNEYEYKRPDNMTAFYQSIRDDAVNQGGSFEGNATSGFYIIDNIRGSYRISSDKPDTIQFASYSLDIYTVEAYMGERKRGTAYNFSFAKPQDINQAIETVRSSITEKGGTFTGDEQQGAFKSSGITGQYQVSEVVNVTISEKPFIIPNSLIENEVKNYFGVR